MVAESMERRQIWQWADSPTIMQRFRFRHQGNDSMRNLFSLAFLAVIFCLTAAYLVHYFRLENTVQHWYRIAEELHEKISAR